MMSMHACPSLSILLQPSTRRQTCAPARRRLLAQVGVHGVEWATCPQAHCCNKPACHAMPCHAVPCHSELRHAIHATWSII